MSITQSVPLEILFYNIFKVVDSRFIADSILIEIRLKVSQIPNTIIKILNHKLI